MGTWAEGNFDNDGALDFVGGLIDELTEKIDACFADEEASRLDEEGEAVIVPSVHIISLLSEHCKTAPPKPAVVTDWKHKFMAIFDAQIGALKPDEGYEQKRRHVIEETFTKLEEQSRRFWREA